jgi:hypothetical protein
MTSMLLMALCVVVSLVTATSAADSDTKPLRPTTDVGAAPKRRPMGRDTLPEAEIAKRRLMNDRENGKRARRLRERRAAEQSTTQQADVAPSGNDESEMKRALRERRQKAADVIAKAQAEMTAIEAAEKELQEEAKDGEL